MKKNIIFIFLLLATFVVALEFNSFDGGLTSENLTFNFAGNQTRDISVYRYANFTSAFMNLSSSTSSNEAFFTGDLFSLSSGGTKGITQNGTFFWIPQDSTLTVHKYWMNGTYTGENFSTASEMDAGLYGATNNNTFMWLTQFEGSFRGIYKYWMNGTYTGESINTFSVGNSAPLGITQNGTFFWVVDDTDNEVYKYLMNGTYTGEKFSASAVGNPAGAGITTNNTFIWITDFFDDRVYKFNMNGTYTGDKFDTRIPGSPQGITQNGSLFWIVDSGGVDTYEESSPTSANISIDGKSIWSLFGSILQGTNARIFSLNDSDISGELTFSGNENITKYLQILKHSNVLSGFIDVKNITGLSNPTLMVNGTTVWNSQSSEPLSTAELISYYKLDESSGAVIDSNGQYNLSNSGADTGATGKIGTAYDFEADDGNDKISGTTLDPDSNDDGYSINAWFKIESFTGSEQDIFNIMETAGWGSIRFGILNDGSLRFRFGCGQPSCDHTNIEPGIITTGQWYMMTTTHNTTRDCIYLNGTLINCYNADSVMQNSDTTMYIGNNNAGSSDFDGIIDELSIWNISLTPDNVSSLYNLGSGNAYPFEALTSENITNDLATPITNFLGDCDPDQDNYCTLPLEFHSDSSGVIEFSNIDIQINNISKTLDFSSILNQKLDSGTCSGGIISGDFCNISFLFHSESAGLLQYSDINLQYNSIPNVTQISPDNNTFSLRDKDFNCSAIDALNLSNITINLFYPNLTLYESKTNDVQGVSNSTSFSIHFNETGDFLWNCVAQNNETFSSPQENRTIKVRDLTLAPQTWTFISPKLNEETKWVNSLVVTNPTDIDLLSELNITTDNASIPSSIVVSNSSGTIFSHDFDTFTGIIKFNATSFAEADTIFQITYNTSNITISEVFYNETIGDKTYRVINFTVISNSTRQITDVDSFLNFDDTATVDLQFLKCNETGCLEDITNRSDVVFSDNDEDGTSDRIDWFVSSLSNQSYQLRRLFGFPVQISQDLQILNEPVRPFDNVEWRNTITFFNPNSFESENILKIELPFGSREIELDGIPKNLQFDPFGTIAPYILIIDKDDPTHKDNLFLLPGQTKTLILEYITDSVTILPEIFQPDYFKVDEAGEINQVLRIKNQADDTVENVEHNIPITFAEDLRACEGEFEDGCPEDGDTDENLTFDEESTVRGNYELIIDSINASEVKHITLSYFIPTVDVIDEVNGKSFAVGFDEQLNFRRYTYESKAPIKLFDVRHDTGINGSRVVSARLCDSNRVCEEELTTNGGLIHLGTFDVSDRKVVEFWFTDEPDQPKGMSFIARFLDFGKEFDITDSPARFVIGWAGNEVNGRLVITTGRIVAILLGFVTLILLSILTIVLIRRRRNEKNN